MSEEDKQKFLASLQNHDQAIYLPESSLIYEREQLQSNADVNYKLYIYRDSKKQFLGAINYDPYTREMEYVPVALCEDDNSLKDKAYINGFEINGTHKMKMFAGDILQLADDTYFVSTQQDASLALSCVAKGEALLLKTLFFDKHKLTAKQGEMPECAYSALIHSLLEADPSGASKRKVFGSIGIGYCYNGEKVARVKVNNLTYVNGVPKWKKWLPLNSAMMGMNTEVNTNGINGAR